MRNLSCLLRGGEIRREPPKMHAYRHHGPCPLCDVFVEKLRQNCGNVGLAATSRLLKRKFRTSLVTFSNLAIEWLQTLKRFHSIRILD